MVTVIQYRNVEYVNSSNFFNDFQKLKGFLFDSDAPFSWGDNNHSLVTVQDIRDHLNRVASPSCVVTKKFDKHCDTVGWDTFIDLEN